MGVLNLWQKITRVLPGQPFGPGKDGAYSSATIPTLIDLSCSGTAAFTTLTTVGTTLANGDVVLIHQTRGTGVGQWEINRVSSGGGTTSLTLQTALKYTYTDSGASQAQAVKIPQYTDVTVQAGTWTVPAWNGNVGGVFPIAVKGTLTVTGNITGNGGAAGSSTSDNGTYGTGGGFYGGGNRAGNGAGYCGEGTAGAAAQSASKNGNGAGGPTVNANYVGGAGGGHSGSGTNGTGGSPVAPGGNVAGSADLITLVFGGGGSGGGKDNANDAVGGGGSGGGIVILFVKNIQIAGGITVNGGAGGSGAGGPDAGGGGGAGGSILIVCATGSLGTTKATSGAGGGGGGGSVGGAGSTGRIAVHHSGTVTGTTNPTFTDTTDTTLVENAFLGAMI